MKKILLFAAAALVVAVAITSPLLGADAILHRDAEREESLVFDDAYYAHLIAFVEEQRHEMERRRAEADSLARLKAESERVLRIACVGDMMLGVNYPVPRLAKNDGRNLLDDVRSYLVDADLTLGNLEGVLLDEGGVPRYGPDAVNAFMFRMPERYAERFVEAGFDFLSIANNHTLDFGVDAIGSTMRTLQGAGIAYAGVQNMCEYAIVERDTLRYGLLAFAPNLLMCDLRNPALGEKMVKKLREELKCDIVIVSVHAGAEGPSATHVTRRDESHGGFFRGNVYAFAHRCVDAGADLVYGHGPHVVRGMELYKGKLIAYSLGNFCTPTGMNLKGKCGYAPVLLVDITPEGEFRGGRIVPAIQPYGVGPKIDTTGVVLREIQTLSRTDFPESMLVIGDDGILSVKE